MSLRLSKHLMCVAAASAIIFIFLAFVLKTEFKIHLVAPKPTSVLYSFLKKNSNPISNNKSAINLNTNSMEVSENQGKEEQFTHAYNDVGHILRYTIEPGFTEGRGKWFDLWNLHYMATRNLPENLIIYKTALDLADAELTLTLLQILTMMMELHNITYFIYGGTLLGSLRHHGTIPWDDDTDIMVDYDHRKKLRNVMKQFNPHYLLYSPNRFTTWKFYSKTSRPTLNVYTQKWKWPFIDIFFFKSKKKAIKDVSWAGDNVVFPKELIFPLSKRPYAFMNLFAPCDPLAFVKIGYNLNECVSRDWDHSKELKISKETRTIPCDLLKQYYPFVQRYNNNSHLTENLLLNGNIIQTRILPNCKHKTNRS